MTVTVSYEQVLSYDTAVVSTGNRKTSLPCAVQPRDLDLIDAVRRCKFLTTPQLLELWWPGTAAQVGRRRLSKLFEAGYLERFRPVARRGSFPWTYKLGREGHRLLQRVGRIPASDRYETRDVYDYRYVLHEVHLHSWIIAWRRLLGDKLVRWDGETQLGSFAELRKLQRSQEFEVGVEGLKDPTPKPLRPDALVEATRGKGGNHVFLVEYDRTRRVDKNFEKFRRYDGYAAWWWRHTEHAASGRAPWIVFVCQDADQRDRFVACADREVTGRVWDSPEGANGKEFPGRHRMVFVDEKDMHAGVAVGLRLPPFPPGHPSRDGTAVQARAVKLPGAEAG